MISPVRTTVSERFPIVSFTLHPGVGRHYEVVCATDPHLLHPGYSGRRTPANFYTSRTHGLLQSDQEIETFLLPQDQLDAFGGDTRLFYALGSYGNPRGDDPVFSLSPDMLERAPSIRLQSRRTAGPSRHAVSAYGAPHQAVYAEQTPRLMRWGGDDAVNQAVAAHDNTARDKPYDDGFGSELWEQSAVRPAASATVPGAAPRSTGEMLMAQLAAGGAGRRHAAGGFGGAPMPGLSAGPGYGAGAAHDYTRAMPEQSLPVGPASAPLGDTPNGAAPVALDIPEQVRLMRIVAGVQPIPLTYNSTVADEQSGLRWGLVGFRQLTGEVGEVLRKAREREQKLLEEGELAPEHTLSALFGEHWEALIAQTDAVTTPDPSTRMQPMDGSALWDQVWMERFASAGAIPYVQAAQNEVAVERVAQPAFRIASWLGLDSALGIALVMGLVVAQGEANGAVTLMNAVGPIRTEADRDSALQATTGSTDLAAFQSSRGLNPDGIWDALSHAALTGALRTLDAASPIVVLNPPQMITSLLNAVGGTALGGQLQPLADHPELDGEQAYSNA